MFRPILNGLLAAGLCAATTAIAQPPHADTTWTVYFEGDSSALDSSARELLDMAVRHALRSGVRAWLVEGHDDRFAAAEASMAMSRRRAEMVRDYLIARGVPPASISVTAHGEEQLASPTYDGVRDPLNRRVSVSARF